MKILAPKAAINKIVFDFTEGVFLGGVALDVVMMITRTICTTNATTYKARPYGRETCRRHRRRKCKSRIFYERLGTCWCLANTVVVYAVLCYAGFDMLSCFSSFFPSSCFTVHRWKSAPLHRLDLLPGQFQRPTRELPNS